ncbi:MAG: MraY family glycosyltransferase [Anaerolineae bacterium]|nr:MraY family glycosyltransferase [Anaerolineae bacterium]
MTYTLHYIIVSLAGFIITLVATPIAGKIGHRLGMVARPGGRRKHEGVISRLGGAGLVIGFFGALAISQVWPITTVDSDEIRRFWGLIGGALIAFIFGIIDDRYELPAGTEYLGYILAASVAIANLIILERFNNPFTDQTIVLPALLYVPLTLFWLTGMTVTVNWLDGLDGLAAGVSAILAIVLSIHMTRSQQYSVVPQALALMGASLGFLVYNASPARTYLGSNGAFFLGYTLGALGLIAGGRVATVLLVMGIPIVDVAWTILDRWRHGLSPFRGDRRHLHFRLQDAGFSTRVIVGIYWAFCAFSGFLALVLSSRLYKLVALVLLGLLTLSLLMYLSREGKQ